MRRCGLLCEEQAAIVATGFAKEFLVLVDAGEGGGTRFSPFTRIPQLALTVRVSGW